MAQGNTLDFPMGKSWVAWPSPLPSLPLCSTHPILEALESSTSLPRKKQEGMGALALILVIRLRQYPGSSYLPSLFLVEP